MAALATIALKRFGSQIAAPGASPLFSDIAAGFAEWGNAVIAYGGAR